MDKMAPWQKQPNPNSNSNIISSNISSNNMNKMKSNINMNKMNNMATNKINDKINKINDKINDNDKDDKVEKRAQNIVLSGMKILKNDGKVRVARNNYIQRDALQPVIPVVNSSQHHNQHYPVDDGKPSGPLEPAKPSLSNLPRSSAADLEKENYHHSSNSLFQSTFQRAAYEFKPPAAAKYFLWDNTRIGSTKFLEPSDLVIQGIKITSSVIKALRIEFLKASLLARASSTITLPPISGLLFGKIDMDNEKCLQMELDRFELGLKRTGVMRGDSVVHVTWTENGAEVGMNYITLLETLKGSITDNPVQNMYTPFPIFAHFSSKEGGEMSSPSFFTVIPSFSIEMYPIHPIRLVNTSLSHQLLTETSRVQGDFGLMSIDQARQIYLLKGDAAIATSIPLIGCWVKADKKMKNYFIQVACLRYISSRSIQKLDTGKEHLLIYYFDAENPSRPECYECFYTRKSVDEYLLYGTVNLSPFELMTNQDFDFALNQVFEMQVSSYDFLTYYSPIKLPPVPDVEKVVAEVENEEYEPFMMAKPKKSADQVRFPVVHENSIDLPVEKVDELAEEPQDVAPIEKEEERDEIQDNSEKPNTIATQETNFVHPVITSNVSIESSQQQMIYLLQQQVAALQSHLMSLSTTMPHIGYHQSYQNQQPQSYNMYSQPVFHNGYAPHRPSVSEPPKPSEGFEENVKNVKEVPKMKDECQQSQELMHDEGVQVTFIAPPQFNTIGTNTSFIVGPPPSSVVNRQIDCKRDMELSEYAKTSEIGSQLEQLNELSVAHPPTDNGQNYRPLFENDNILPKKEELKGFNNSIQKKESLAFENILPAKADTNFHGHDLPKEELHLKQAKDIISGLVGNAEESFYHTDTEVETTMTSQDSKSMLPPLKPKPRVGGAAAMKRPVFPAAIQRLSKLDHGTSSRDSSFRLDQPTDDLSLSFATMNYLEKYGLK